VTQASSATATPSGLVDATDGDNGKTIAIHVGQAIRVNLASTYWQFQPVSSSAVLALSGTPRITPTHTCVPGEGCGSAIATYTAAAVGTATIIATRSSCGEAQGCTPASGTFTLHVTVT